MTGWRYHCEQKFKFPFSSDGRNVCASFTRFWRHFALLNGHDRTVSRQFHLFRHFFLDLNFPLFPWVANFFKIHRNETLATWIFCFKNLILQKLTTLREMRTHSTKRAPADDAAAWPVHAHDRTGTDSSVGRAARNKVPPRPLGQEEPTNPKRPGFLVSSTEGVGVNHTSGPRLFGSHTIWFHFSESTCNDLKIS